MQSLNRRGFLGAAGAGLALGAAGLGRTPAAMAMPVADTPQGPIKSLAVVTTLWNYRSHAWHMAERFLAGYPREGRWHKPPFKVVSAYVDQTRKDDLSRGRAKEFGFTIYPTIAEALRNGGKSLAVDAVLVIGEHGDYPLSPIGQKKYPRYEFFKQIAEVFEADGKVTPVFNDKHLSWNYAWAKEMVATSKRLKIPFLAGSSLPVTWRMPDVDLPLGAEVEEVMGIAFGAVDIYDFHALEMIQSMAERRKGGETGVVSMHALRGPAVWEAMSKGSWAAGGWDPGLFEACLSRSQTLGQAETTSHRYPSVAQMKEWVKEPVAYRFEYADGTRGTMLQLNKLVEDFTFAAKLKGKPEPLSTLFYLPPNPNVTYSASLMTKAEELFTTGKAPYPVERTLLTSGLVSAGMQSLKDGQIKIATPHLDVKYQPNPVSQYVRT